VIAETEKKWQKLDLDKVQEKADRGKKLSDAESRFLRAHRNGGFKNGPSPTPPRPGNPHRAARKRARSARRANR